MAEFPVPEWKKPSPLGLAPAFDMVTGIAAPVLAGFSVATIVIVVSAADHFKWPGATLLCLTIGLVLLVASLQFGFHARSHLYSPQEIYAWWTPADFDASPGRLELRRSEQAKHFQRWEVWVRRASITYDVGIIALAAGLGAALAPLNSEHATEAALRWTALSICWLGAALECIWHACDLRSSRKRNAITGIQSPAILEASGTTSSIVHETKSQAAPRPLRACDLCGGEDQHDPNCPRRQRRSGKP
jgi:hypothetical protein